MVWLYQETPKWQELLHFLFDQSATSLLDRIFAGHHPITFHASNVCGVSSKQCIFSESGPMEFRSIVNIT